jgi:hypothetical protein
VREDGRTSCTRVSEQKLGSERRERDVMGLPGLIHDGERGVEYLIPKPAVEEAFGSLGGSKSVMPCLTREGLAVVENLRTREYQMKRQLGRKLRVRLYVIKAEILERR